ncbi:MAG: cofactor-independent phosphoglycerate mutase [Candidatus Aminicenantes bacterium]|nr:cofactor-independent phosphoglycerate mutase [Candidatus Aminicenantes bacterium]
MKYLLLIGDGMADYPIGKLGGKTPLQAADTPNMDELAKKGRCGRFITIPPGMPTGSAVANLSILGYNPRVCFQGRGVLEAASMGVKLDPEDVAFRCNIICVRNNKIKSHSGGHITTKEAIELIKTIDHKLGTEYIKFYPGVSYRHLLVLKGGKFSANVECTPPHDALDRSITKVLVRAKDKEAEKTANLLNKMILDSQSILEGHPVNLERAKKGKDKANMIWPWSAGEKPLMRTFQERFGVRGAVIAAVDLIKGVSIYAGFDVIDVEGATGLYNTNYEGKADACLKALKSYDLVWVHVEASDEASHEGDLDLKIKTIEYFDKRLVGRVLDSIDEDIHIALLPDHFTPVSMRTHVADAVPFLIYDPQKEADEVSQFDEFSCAKGSLGLLKGDNFIRMFLGK